MKRNFVPPDSKYIPLTQQKWLCSATCIQMVMLRHQIPLVSAEEIANMMGLLVPKEDQKLFWNARTGPKPKSGYGTQAGKPNYGPNFVFKKLGIPLKMNWSLINKFKTKEQFYKYLEELEKKDLDILVCFDWGTLFDKDYHGGHICVLDKIDLKEGAIRIIDPEVDVPKWRIVKIDKLFEAMRYHGKDNSGGFWELSLNQRNSLYN